MPNILFASDIDGTLLVNHKIPQENIDAIRKLQSLGHSFCVVTGRDIGMIPKEIADLCDYYVTINGAGVFDKKRNAIYDCKIDKEDAFKIYEIASNSSSRHIWVHNLDSYFDDDRHDHFELPERSIYANYLPFQEVLSKDIYQVSFDYNPDNTEEFDEVFKKINSIDSVTLYPNNGGADVMSNKCSKALGLKILQDYAKFDKVYVCGDGENDLPMIKAFESFGMITGSNEVKNNATHITNSVAEAIEYVLNNND